MMPFRYSLRQLLSFCFVVCFVASFIGLVVRGVLSVQLVTGIAGRTLALALVGAVVGLAMRKVRSALVSATIAVVIADLVWIVFLLSIGSTMRSQIVVYNPLLLIALVACPSACAKSTLRGIILGVVLSILLPLIVAIWYIGRLPSGPGVRGTGLASVMTVMVAIAAMFTGIVATFIARVVCELTLPAIKGDTRNPDCAICGPHVNSTH